MSRISLVLFHIYDFIIIQGPPTLVVSFDLDILETYKDAKMLFLGSNKPQLNDI